MNIIDEKIKITVSGRRSVYGDLKDLIIGQFLLLNSNVELIDTFTTICMAIYGPYRLDIKLDRDSCWCIIKKDNVFIKREKVAQYGIYDHLSGSISSSIKEWFDSAIDSEY